MQSVTLTAEQREAADRILEFARRGGDPVFTLHGLAGTGKTTVLAEIARELPRSHICTLTGKAASVLRTKGIPACTIHSLFYRLRDARRDAKGRKILEWDRAHDEDDLAGSIVLIDESSMVNEAMARDILHTGARIVACGDPGQLPPVTGRQFFDRADVTLREIHRQALESPIIRQAHAVRSSGQYKADGAAFRIERQASDADMLATDAILCFTNRTKDAANAEARKVRGFWQPYPQAGEPVMCLRNAPEHGIFNGGVYELGAPFLQGDRDIRLSVDGEPVTVCDVTFKGTPSSLPDDVEATTSFDFGYAMTVHKAQGSEWSRVILLDEYNRTENRKEWLYTGLTRAAESILVISDR